MSTTGPRAGKRWTDSGEVHDRRGLKHRAAAESRVVPIPPELVGIPRRHVDRFGVADDGRLFRSDKGNVVAASTYSRVWKAARELALTPVQVASPLAGRLYDLRHAAVLSDWLDKVIGTERFDAIVDEDIAVWSALHRISGTLDKSLVEIFMPEYTARLDAARTRLLGDLGDHFVQERQVQRAAGHHDSGYEDDRDESGS